MSSVASRRAVLAGAAGITTAAGLFGGAGLIRAAVSDVTNISGQLRIGYLPITDAAPLLLAHSAGMHPDGAVSAVKPVLFRSWAALAEAFMARQIDVAHLLMPMAIQLRQVLGHGVRVLGWNHTNGSALTVAPGIEHLEDLAGTQVAIPFWWSIHNIVLQELLRGQGLRPVVRSAASRSQRTVELVVMSPSDMVPALANRSIGGYVVADPFNAIAQIKKIGRIHTFLGDVWRDHACCVLVTRDDVIAARASAVQGVTDAVVAAQLWIDADRKAAASALGAGKYLPQPIPAVQTALTYPNPPYPLKHPDWHPQRLGFQPFPYRSFTQRLVESMHDTVVDGDRGFLNRLDPARVHDDLVDDTFVRAAIATHGGPEAFGITADFTRTEQVQAL
ncbi:putative sulfonate ABC transporter, periplasmic protein [Mycolicibacterium phlei]|uniref:ABC transporter substrate-binding protein n=1 Tax=Mycobacteroides chelonae TaxID=1774 RepID=UPI000618CBBA|nr:ABC transporter substrate-binding protein [Mycobacteroides chelonae]VEG16798.1 putative sulfonate ABC transporter, periplasmic protein [Mycolicibacterium phlei]AKC39114.1 ABC transporter substrate-binding protein [Mycobacteroides chelonae]ANA98463.1 ABC transporter substrate-binding protein [Mycobacteroides chelonae CCUG 47445]OLT72253.1 ABC transporter substrate-binding protein [Mycobacteroides chelonae]ORV11571.1 ABC transporter substrate-binding protein [Mycobacteroides chelonae]